MTSSTWGHLPSGSVATVIMGKLSPQDSMELSSICWRSSPSSSRARSCGSKACASPGPAPPSRWPRPGRNRVAPGIKRSENDQPPAGAGSIRAGGSPRLRPAATPAKSGGRSASTCLHSRPEYAGRVKRLIAGFAESQSGSITQNDEVCNEQHWRFLWRLFCGPARALALSRFPVLQTQAAEFCRKLSALPEEKKAGRVYRRPTEAE